MSQSTFDGLILLCFVVVGFTVLLLIGGAVFDYLERRQVRRALRLERARRAWAVMLDAKPRSHR